MKEYFSHDYNARNDKKLMKLFMKHGVLGIGIYWCIIEMLYEESGYLSTNEYERITFELRTDYEIVKSVINDFELFKIKDDLFYSESAINRLNERSNKSQKARESINKRWEKIKKNTNVLQTNNDSNTIKVKKSKVKESKKDALDDDFELQENGRFECFWNDYDKKVGDKEKIKAKFLKLPTKEQMEIFNHIPKYKESQPNKKYRKNPETYLNNKGWLDEIITDEQPIINKPPQKTIPDKVYEKA